MSAERPFCIRIDPQWRDMDALGHVNNAVYSTWLENARAAYWTAFSGEFDRFPFMLARTEIDFRSPVTWREPVHVKVWIARFGNTSFDIAYSIDTISGRHVADAKTVVVLYDHAAGRAVPIDAALRTRLEAFLSTLKQAHPRVPLMIGGPEVTLEWETYSRNPDVAPPGSWYESILQAGVGRDSEAIEAIR